MKTVIVSAFATFLSLVCLTESFSIRDIKRTTPFSPEGECPSRDTNETIFLTDNENCTIYYLCSNGIPIQLVCPPDMAFNPVSHICDWAIDVQCEKRKKNMKGNFKSPVGSCPEKDPQFPVFLPDSQRCDIYYECSGGEPIQNECSPGLEFNPSLNVCDFPLDAGCKVSSSSNKRIKSAMYSAVGTCPEKDPAFPVFLPDSERCDIYYECSGGETIQNECSPGLEFNPILNVCDFPLDAGCKASGDNVGEIHRDTLSAIGSCPPRDTNETIFLPDDKNCTIYYLCSNGNPILNICPPGQSWNAEIETCDWDLNVDCSRGLRSAPQSAVGTCSPRDPTTPVYLPDSDDCSIYYQCSNGNAIQNVCPPDMSWNTVLNVCDWAVDVPCVNGTKISF